ncbi:MAG: hypothetical protein A2583_14600 [Bdellovibrionales bacterium RIFOXYD1_FULL_53_11]|nr:MAG: hypothetical protein A2583_14600 [Bdellovibrionales bacterium RIFOXYD1_FULL_53_11]
MKKTALAFGLIILAFGITVNARKIPDPWPADRADEHDLEYDPDDSPRMIPYDKMVEYINQNPYESIPLEEMPRMPALGAAANYSLLAAQSPVKSQGNRGQCHNFSVTAALEYSVWAGEKEAQNFSEQCNAWKFYYDCDGCSLNPESTDDGGWPQKEAVFISDKFMKFETDYPYSNNPTFCKKNFDDAPVKNFSNIVVYKILQDRIKEAIDNNLVVTVGTFWRDGWNKYGEYEYKLLYPICTALNCGGHAVTITGYDDHWFGQDKGGWIFKNSWGTWWGEKKGQKPAGYGVIPYPYLRQFGHSATAISHKNAVLANFPKGCIKKRRK